jgi:hypothetical protein
LDIVLKKFKKKFKCEFFVTFELFALLNVIIEADSQKHPCAGAFAVYYGNSLRKEVLSIGKNQGGYGGL